MTAPATTRQRIVDAAVRLTADGGWPAVTMAAVGEHAGVSRQTVYNEIGSRERLAEAVVLDELGRYLDAVGTGFDRHPGDLRAALRAAVLGVLRRAETSPLLAAVLAPGGRTDLLPPLTTDAAAVIAAASAALDARLDAYPLGVDGRARSAAVDMVVRTVLSHVMQPGRPAARTADDVAALAVRLLT